MSHTAQTQGYAILIMGDQGGSFFAHALLGGGASAAGLAFYHGPQALRDVVSHREMLAGEKLQARIVPATLTLAVSPSVE